MILQALEIALLGWIFAFIEIWFGYPMVNIPLVVGTAVGFLCQDLTTGLLLGAMLQLIFIGVVGIGGTLPADAALGTLIATALAMRAGQSSQLVFLFAIFFSLLAIPFHYLQFRIRTWLVPLTSKFIENNNQRGLQFLHFSLAWFSILPKYIFVFLVLVLCQSAYSQIIAWMPQRLMEGIELALGLLPVVSIALLLQRLANKENFIYFFLGAGIIIFLSQSLVTVAICGVIVASFVVIKEKKKESKKQNSLSKSSEEKELFDD